MCSYMYVYCILWLDRLRTPYLSVVLWEYSLLGVQKEIKIMIALCVCLC